ncbi:MAG: glycosyl hydrolase [Verrucomicrobiota bacterium]
MMIYRTLLAVCLGCACAFGGIPELAKDFAQPPAAARPWVYWFFMDGNLSQEGMTADLEAMKQAGIGGVIMMEVDVGIPRGTVKFMSPEWQVCFRHAVKEAERLGLQITLNAGPGWTGSGGPWIKPEQSMQHLVSSETNLASGPMHFDAPLPRPLPRRPFFGDGHLPADIEKERKAFYRDVAVLAFPTPSGNQRIEDIEEKALYQRAPFSSQPGVKPWLAAPAEHAKIPVEQCIASSGILDLTSRLTPEGRLVWDVPPGQWTIMRLGKTSTGQGTRPAPQPGLGLECDKLDPAALDAHFAAFVEPLLRAVGPRKPGVGWTMLHIDSWEMSSQNWTGRMREEFQKRRGYDLLRYLPALSGRIVDSVEISERFLWDLRRTAQELAVENHAQHLKDLAHRNGMGLSIEPYDMNPAGDLSLGSVADVPMCEFWSKGYGFKSEFSCIESVSIGHVMGRPIIAAEAFTSGSSERWQQYPGAMKSQGDWAFCAGINRIVFHRFQHQPWADRKPGMTMGPYGVHWERTQTWWDMVPAYHAYLARCQTLLQHGLPVADILYLAAEGAPHVFLPPKSALSGELPDRRGYNFDGCAPETLISRVSVNNGRLVLPDGMSYQVLVLPNNPTMTPALLRKVKELAEAGATIIGAPPLKSPSLSGYPQCDDEVKLLADALWGNSNGQPGMEHPVGRGRVIRDATAQTEKESGDPLSQSNHSKPPANPEQYGDYTVVADLLKKMGVPPDFQSELPLRYTHRSTGEAEIYFVANATSETIRGHCTFRVSGKAPELWNPLIGDISDLPEYFVKDGRTTVPMRFEPNESGFIVFRKTSTPGKTRGPNFCDFAKITELTGPWEVAFDPKWGGPDQITFPSLEDWSKRPEEGIRFYSGTATYRQTFDLPQVPRGQRIYLDLGLVKNMARVRLNGRDLGVAWCAPWRVEITSAAKAKANQLEIAVANLWPNRLIGDQSLPPEKRYAFATWNPFKKNMPLLESGLLGPVTLQAMEIKQP